VPSPKQGGGQPRNEQRAAKTDRQAQAGQPDPMKTAFGYIGADSFTRQRQGQGQSQRRGGGGGNGPAGGGNRRGRGR
jgi:23S rRNA pseudouridine2605 synthase